MARSDTVTLLPLDRYAQIMHISLPHFNQLDGSKAPLVNECAGLWDQDARDLLAWTMAQAEEMIAEYLNFWPAPKFIIDEEIQFGLPGIRGDWWNAEIPTRWGNIICFGTETLTLKKAGASVTYTNSNNNPQGRENLATISATALYGDELGACDDKCETVVFFREEDGAEDPADSRWEIRPLRVDIDGSTMSITGDSSLFVKPTLWELTEIESAGSVDSNAWHIDFDVANLVSSVDVYCRTINQATPITLLWEGVCDCPGVCEHATQTACAYKTDNRRGFFAPRAATWSGTSNVFAVPKHSHIIPESVKANYRSGMALNKSCRMNPSMERAIVKLTNALLPNAPCGFCDHSHSIWAEDRKEVDSTLFGGFTPPWDMFRAGAYEAFKIVKLFARGRGGKMGRGYR